MKKEEKEEKKEVLFLEEEGVQKINEFLQIVSASEKLGVVDFRAAYGNFVSLVKTYLKK